MRNCAGFAGILNRNISIIMPNDRYVGNKVALQQAGLSPPSHPPKCWTSQSIPAVTKFNSRDQHKAPNVSVENYNFYAKTDPTQKTAKSIYPVCTEAAAINLQSLKLSCSHLSSSELGRQQLQVTSNQNRKQSLCKTKNFLQDEGIIYLAAYLLSLCNFTTPKQSLFTFLTLLSDATFASLNFHLNF